MFLNEIQNKIEKRNPWKENSRIFAEKYTANTEQFPHDDFRILTENGFHGANVPTEYDGWGLDKDSEKLLNILRLAGMRDLSLGRIYEGHINAILLVMEYGNNMQKEQYFQEAIKGKLFGVWNSDLPSEALRLNSAEIKPTLVGAKIFCSGASHVHRPIITAATPQGKQMVVFHLDEHQLTEDYTYWKPMGMKASVSCRFDFSGISISENQMLGDLDDYERQPDFSGGAIRFAAVQLGGAEAAINATVRHLKKLGRTSHLDQIRRLGQLAILRERGQLWLKGAARAMDRKREEPHHYRHYANMFRTEVRKLCEVVLQISEMCVGLQGLLEPHPLERIHRDLTVYLKQPGPDKALSEVGAYSTTNSGQK